MIELRKKIDLFEYSPEILSFFNSNNYKKTKDGLSNAISDWMDNEFYTYSDRKQKIEFVEKYSKDFNI